jgi:hypothetical protein
MILEFGIAGHSERTVDTMSDASSCLWHLQRLWHLGSVPAAGA